jgi:outer membrane lipoprotein-sorting protein
MPSVSKRFYVKIIRVKSLFYPQNNPMKKALLTLILTTFFLKVNAQNADQIVQKYLQQIGGEKAWKTIKTISSSGIYNYGGIEFPFTAIAKAPNKYKFIVPLNGKHYTQVFNGKTGWKIDAFKNETKPQYLTGKPARALANEADVEIENPLINYQKKGFAIHLEGKETVEGKDCFKVNLFKKEGEVESYFIDNQEYALVMKRALSKNDELEKTILDAYFSDYREINGVKIPFVVSYRFKVQNILKITTERVQMNEKVVDSIFK